MSEAAKEASPAAAAPPDVPLLPPQHWTDVPEVFDDNDADSALGDDAPDSTASLTSSILKYRTIQGRTYHSERGNAQYWGTNDERHNDSLDIMHHIFTLCLEDKLYLAPLKDPKKVLDVGTGTGLWAIDFADAFHDCKVIGTDISPIQPTWVPPNLAFEMEDFTSEWTFPPATFDYIHMRYLVGCVPDWTALFGQAYRALVPGGYIESYEASPTVHTEEGTPPLPPDSAVAQWGPLFTQGGKAIGRSFTVCEDGELRRAMEEAGFVDIQERNIKCPTGTWPSDPRLKEIAQYGLLAVTQDVEGFILFLTNVLGWSREQVQVYVAHLRRELRSGKYHVWYWHKVLVGRKPEGA